MVQHNPATTPTLSCLLRGAPPVEDARIVSSVGIVAATVVVTLDTLSHVGLLRQCGDSQTYQSLGWNEV